MKNSRFTVILIVLFFSVPLWSADLPCFIIRRAPFDVLRKKLKLKNHSLQECIVIENTRLHVKYKAVLCDNNIMVFGSEAGENIDSEKKEFGKYVYQEFKTFKYHEGRVTLSLTGSHIFSIYTNGRQFKSRGALCYTKGKHDKKWSPFSTDECYGPKRVYRWLGDTRELMEKAGLTFENDLTFEQNYDKFIRMNEKLCEPRKNFNSEHIVR